MCSRRTPLALLSLLAIACGHPALAGSGDASTGLRVYHYGSSGKLEPQSFSIEPFAVERQTLVSSTDEKGVVHPLPHGAYWIALDNGERQLVQVSEGKVTDVRSGQGSLVVQAQNYYGAPLAAEVELVRAAPAAQRRVPHSTLPMVPPREEPATQPATRPASDPSTMPATRPAGAPATRPAAGAAGPSEPGNTEGAAARGVTGKPIDAPAGTYDVLVRAGSATLLRQGVRIQPGRPATVAVRFGALRVTGAVPRFEVLDAAGNRVANGSDRTVVHLAPGAYHLRSATGARLATVEVEAGDMALVELE